MKTWMLANPGLTVFLAMLLLLALDHWITNIMRAIVLVKCAQAKAKEKSQ